MANRKQGRPSAGLPRAIVVCSILAGYACDDRIIEPNVPPAGWARLEGTVEDASGAPAVGVEVALGPCGEPIFGRAGDDETDAQGEYVVEGRLPQRDIYFFPDSLDVVEVECSVHVDRTELVEAITIPFYQRRRDVVPVELDLMVN